VGKGLENRRGFTVLDALITLCLIGALFGVVVPKYQRVAHEARETALKAELTNIRMSITLFKVLNGRNPRSLNELVEKNVILPARIGSDAYTGSVFNQKYLMPNAVDGKGNILDAFGNPFTYDSRKGEVKATTEGYENR
jgi:type II secretory pathway pseudopilin PulG